VPKGEKGESPLAQARTAARTSDWFSAFVQSTTEKHITFEYFQKLLELISKQFLATSPGEPYKILDVGCGEGTLSEHIAGVLQQEGVPVEYTGIEFDPRFVKETQAKLTQLGVQHQIVAGDCFSGDIDQLPNQPSMIVISHIAYYTGNIPAFMASLAKKMGPNTIVVSIHASHLSMQAMLREEFKAPILSQASVEIQEAMEQQGLSTFQAVYTSFMQFDSSISDLPRIAIAPYEKLEGKEKQTRKLLEFNVQRPMETLKEEGCLEKYVEDVSSESQNLGPTSRFFSWTQMQVSVPRDSAWCDVVRGAMRELIAGSKEAISPMHWAAYQGRLDVAEFIATQVPEVELIDKKGPGSLTPLHMAVCGWRETGMERYGRLAKFILGRTSDEESVLRAETMAIGGGELSNRERSIFELLHGVKEEMLRGRESYKVELNNQEVEELICVSKYIPAVLNLRSVFSRGVFSQALKQQQGHFDDIVRLLPFGCSKGFLWTVIKKEEDARELLKAVFEGVPREKLEIYKIFAESLEGMGFSDMAVEILREMVKVFPIFEVYAELATLLERKGEPSEAESVYTQFIEKNPIDPWGYLELADFLVERKKPDEAELAYRKAISFALKEFEVYRSLADFLEDRGELKKAEYVYEQAMFYNPEQKWPVEELAALREKKGCCVVETEEDFEEPEDTGSHGNRNLAKELLDLARLEEKKGDADKAEIYYSKALELRPWDWNLRADFRQFLIRQKEPQEGLFEAFSEERADYFFPASTSCELQKLMVPVPKKSEKVECMQLIKTPKAEVCTVKSKLVKPDPYVVKLWKVVEQEKYEFVELRSFFTEKWETMGADSFFSEKCETVGLACSFDKRSEFATVGSDFSFAARCEFAYQSIFFKGCPEKISPHSVKGSEATPFSISATPCESPSSFPAEPSGIGMALQVFKKTPPESLATPPPPAKGSEDRTPASTLVTPCESPSSFSEKPSGIGMALQDHDFKKQSSASYTGAPVISVEKCTTQESPSLQQEQEELPRAISAMVDDDYLAAGTPSSLSRDSGGGRLRAASGATQASSYLGTESPAESPATQKGASFPRSTGLVRNKATQASGPEALPIVVFSSLSAQEIAEKLSYDELLVTEDSKLQHLVIDINDGEKKEDSHYQHAEQPRSFNSMAEMSGNIAKGTLGAAITLDVAGFTCTTMYPNKCPVSQTVTDIASIAESTLRNVAGAALFCSAVITKHDRANYPINSLISTTFTVVGKHVITKIASFFGDNLVQGEVPQECRDTANKEMLWTVAVGAGTIGVGVWLGVVTLPSLLVGLVVFDVYFNLLKLGHVSFLVRCQSQSAEADESSTSIKEVETALLSPPFQDDDTESDLVNCIIDPDDPDEIEVCDVLYQDNDIILV
jgi:tetratricopeptide (TPR) repeat protein/2-polyprenyl-3-methyl-5-hydroxy-6-metoxy-1,4-benzoquinol methylase